MCPLCDHGCDFTPLSNSCLYAKITYFFDNPVTVAFAIFMAFWATTFLEMWKRHQAVLDWKWNLMADSEHEPTRPEYEKVLEKLSKKRISKLTFEEEMVIPLWSKMWRKIASSSVVFFMVFVVVIAVIGTVVYRVALLAVIYSAGNEDLRGHAKLLASASAAFINLIVILILTTVYKQLANWLTELECPRTQSEYETSYTFKMYVFQFMNYYSSLIYIAFFKGRFYTYPGDPEMRGNVFLAIQRDVCDPAGCLSELFIQLAVIMVGKQALNNAQEYFLPMIQRWWKRWRYGYSSKTEDLPQWEEDYLLQDYGKMGLFEEYLEMIIQYGFVTLFVAAFPLAPAFAFLNNILELRIDANKLVTQTRRPVINKVKDIGAWYGILRAITFFAVVTNAFVIAYTTDFIPRIVYKYSLGNGSLTGFIQHSLSKFNTSDYTPDQGIEPTTDTCYYRGYRQYNPDNEMNDRYVTTSDFWYINGVRLAFVVVFEHIVFALTGILAYAIPDVPADIQKEMLKEKQNEMEKKYKIERRRGRRNRRNRNTNPPA